jgi:hypothetical protein
MSRKGSERPWNYVPTHKRSAAELQIVLGKVNTLETEIAADPFRRDTLRLASQLYTALSTRASGEHARYVPSVAIGYGTILIEAANGDSISKREVAIARKQARKLIERRVKLAEVSLDEKIAVALGCSNRSRSR